ncbi:MAG TPA: pilus assembly protein PilP [Haliangium sp.]|nr:pilus assembly protein PilP [Haliangium sp.]
MMPSKSSSLPHDAARRARSRRGPSRFAPVAAIVAAILLAAGCGDSETAPATPMVTPVTPAQPNAAAQGGAAKPAGLRFHTKIEDLIGAEQAQLIRHKFTADDFGPNIGGTGRRDPFRSLAAAQLAAQAEQQDQPIDPAQTCKDRVADTFSLRDMRLVGIVLRGTRSYALFVDKGEKGHIVTRGDCLGVEKARVLSVRAGFVTLQLYPDATQPTAETELQERTIALYPDELSVEGETP